MVKLVSSASMIRILIQALHSKIEAYGLFVYTKIELCGSHRIAVFKKFIDGQMHLPCLRFRRIRSIILWASFTV